MDTAETRVGVEASRVQELEERVQKLEKRLATVEERVPEDKVTLVVFSGDLDRVLASFVIATGAAAMGQQVSMFFTFWGLSVLKKSTQLSGKTLFQKMMAVMSPGSTQEPAGLEDELLRRGRQDAAVHDEGEERQLARRDDRAGARIGRAHDRLRDVPRHDGDQGIGTGRRTRMRRCRDLSGRLAEITDQPVHLTHAVDPAGTVLFSAGRRGSWATRPDEDWGERLEWGLSRCQGKVTARAFNLRCVG